jgi:prepilin-type N-terminal cleavage/methylation domain-containing protein
MRRRFPTFDSRGFSLVEFLMVAIILGIGLLGLAALTTTAMRGYSGSRTLDSAVALSSSVMDRLSADGRISAQLRSISGSTIPTSALVANATDGKVNTYTDPATQLGTFDLQGQPSSTQPVFTVKWVRRADKGLSPVTASLADGAEVVVNIEWNEAVKNASTGATSVLPHYISASRFIRY